MFKKNEASNNLTRFVKKRAKNLEKTYGKNGVIINSIDENTRQLKELIEEVRELKKYMSEK